jgi:hypothetical protein
MSKKDLAADPPWLPGCKANIAKIPGGVLCSDQHCTEAQQQNHMICYCQAPWNNGCPEDPNNRPPNCCSYSATSPVYVALQSGGCYCCCGCFSFDTQVAISDTETRAISEIMLGDLVYVAEDASLKKWGTKTVQFSSGTGTVSKGSVMIQVDFGSDPNHVTTLYVTQNQVFYMPGAKLKRANKLVPGDLLVRQDGSTVPVISLTVGKYEKGIHHIATSQNLATNMAGHLILAKGIVCGDYALQLTTGTEFYIDGHDALPELGTKEYLEAYKHIPHVSTFKASSLAPAANDADKGHEDGVYRTENPAFIPYGENGIARVPDDVNYFVTKQQAKDILKNAPQAPPGSGAGLDIYNYLTKLFKGFYPDMNFYLDDGNELPNAYSFVEYDKKFIVVNGGLIRTEAVMFELLALVLAHEVGHLTGGNPKGRNGYTCEGMADFAAIGSVFPYVWFGFYSFGYRQAALEQVQTFFNFIDKDHRGGLLGSRCNNISIDCRLKSMNAAASSRLLPFCAGGPADPFLEVTGATAASSGGHMSDVTISFNVPVNVDTAESIGNYAFNPRASAFSVKVSATNPSKVIVSATLKPGTDYQVTVYNVLSAKDEPLVTGKNSASFTSPIEVQKGVSSVS